MEFFKILGRILFSPIGIPILGVMGYTFICSVFIFLCCIEDNRNPYTTYIDKTKRMDAVVAKRNYFFGPGYHQIAMIIQSAFRGMIDHVGVIKGYMKEALEIIGDRKTYQGTFLSIFVVIIMFCFAILFNFTFGFVWVAIFSILL